MILGVVTSNAQAVIRLNVYGPRHQEGQIDGVIDTGFDGSLTLPPRMIATLSLVWRRRGRALLGDGTESIFDIYEAALDWDRELRRIAVDEADATPLVGMALMSGYELRIQVVDGGSASLERLPQKLAKPGL